MIDLGGDDRGWRGPSEQWKRDYDAVFDKEFPAPTLDDYATKLLRPMLENHGLVEPDEPKIEYATGYPFMQLAKRHGVDYGDVLIVAQWITEHPVQLAFEAEDYVRQHLCKIPRAVAHKIYKLISQPAYLRGAVGHDVV